MGGHTQRRVANTNYCLLLFVYKKDECSVQETPNAQLYSLENNDASIIF